MTWKNIIIITMAAVIVINCAVFFKLQSRVIALEDNESSMIVLIEKTLKIAERLKTSQEALFHNQEMLAEFFGVHPISKQEYNRREQ